MGMSWKITQTRNPKWLAVIGPYDEDFITSIKRLPTVDRWRCDDLGAWMVHVDRRRALELIIVKHSPPPVVELLAGADGVAQVFDHASRLGEAIAIPDLIESLSLAGVTATKIVTVEVDGNILIVASVQPG